VDLNRLTQKSQEALSAAQDLAVRSGHTEVDGEHLLLTLLELPDGLVPQLLTGMGVDVDGPRGEVEATLRRKPKTTGPAGQPGQVSVTNGWRGCCRLPGTRRSG
jgi:ATP-dependent Clp protease ATP-binding subunit ClpB